MKPSSFYFNNNYNSAKKLIDKYSSPESVEIYGKQKSKKWHEMRSKCICGSEAASALGKNHFQDLTTFKLEKAKYMHTLIPSFQGNQATYHGERYEDIAVLAYLYDFNTKYAPKYKMTHHEMPSVVKEDKHLSASPDGICVVWEMGNGKWKPIGAHLVEIKCPPKRKLCKNEPPDHYYDQLEMQMFICEIDRVDFIDNKIVEHEVKDKVHGDVQDNAPTESISFIDFGIKINKNMPTLKVSHSNNNEFKLVNRPCKKGISLLEDIDDDSLKPSHYHLSNKSITKIWDTPDLKNTVIKEFKKINQKQKKYKIIEWTIIDRTMLHIKQNPLWEKKIVPKLINVYNEIVELKNQIYGGI